MSAVHRSTSVTHWRVSETLYSLLARVANLTSAVWNRISTLIQHFCCCSKNDAPPQSVSQLTLLQREVDRYRLGRPLTEDEKADLRAKKDKAEEVFEQQRVEWINSFIKAKTPDCMQYCFVTKGEIEQLLAGEALPVLVNLRSYRAYQEGREAKG